MDKNVIYLIVHNPTSHTYLTVNDDGTLTEHYSQKRARLLRPDAEVRTYVMKEA